MLPQELIRAKRDGRVLERDDVRDFIAGLSDGRISEGQVAAFAMAVFFRGMSPDEIVGLTQAMRDSGTVLTWDLPGPVVDKHSTGGIGDTVSLMLAPMLAACGCFVPMISGRGLGHTGGTLDKLEAIPGYNTKPGPEIFRQTVRETGAAIIGQTADLAPADKRLYGIRDVTATVESVPLITASILSKKLAAGLHYLVMDVKVGSGAFMTSLEEARTLAESLVRVANGAGLKTTALITDMDQPLASSAGNAVEVQTAVNYLTGVHRDDRLHQVTMALAGELLVTTGLAGPEAAQGQLEGVLASGQAAECFQHMVSKLGGPHDFVSRASHYLPRAPIIRPVMATQDGTISAIDTRALGLAVIELGGGRTRADDVIDPAVGLTDLAPVGARAERLATVHARDEDSFARAAATVRKACQTGEPPPHRRLVAERIAP